MTTYRVPRSRVDDLFDKGSPLPFVQVGAAEVLAVSANGEEITVDFGDEEVGGIAVLGCPPDVGDWVEIEARGDLLVTPDTGGETSIEGGGAALVYVQLDEPLDVEVGTLWFDTDEIIGGP
jgi:hypothetical protein